MKSMFSLLVVLAALSASAQTAVRSTLTPVAPGFGNVFGSFITGTNVPSNLNTGLAALQNDIQQLLPVLADFNDTTALSALLATLRASATGGASVPPPLSGQLLSTRTSSDFATLSSQNFSTSLATSVATPTAGGTFSPAISPIQPVVVPSDTGALSSPVMTNAFGATVTILDVARDLVVLQNDLERLLPVLVTLNGSGVPAGFTNTVGSSVGNSPAPTSPVPTLSPVLTPTGR
jgi:hypothetical protein